MTAEELEQFIINHSGIPARFRNKTLDDLEPQFAEHVRRAKKYVEEFSKVQHSEQPGLYLFSPTDVGVAKSHIVSCILRGLVYSGHIRTQMTYYQFGDLMLSLVAESRGEMTEQNVEHIRRLDTSEMVVFDDIDKFSGTANAVYRLHRIVGDLWDRQVPLLVTSNLTLMMFGERLEAIGADKITARSVVSRLTGMCALWKFELGHDYRVDTGGSSGAVEKSYR